jgi:hypothetical protein
MQRSALEIQPLKFFAVSIATVRLDQHNVEFFICAWCRLQARSFGRTEQRPLRLGLHPAHEKIWDPKSVKQVAGPVLLAAVVLAQLKKNLQSNEHAKSPR